MAIYTRTNGKLRMRVGTAGAELVQLVCEESGKNYLWTGDPAYWNRISPVLFPIVGGLKNREYTWEGNTYSLAQHGFARDKEFELKEEAEDSLCFSLQADEDTKRCYPFDFSLDIGYRLSGKSLIVTWEVRNPASRSLYFSIGGHPAFLCPLDPGEKQSGCYLGFDTKKELMVTPINENGLALEEAYALPLADGLLRIREDLFDHDALVIERDQAHRVFLAGADGRPYVTVEFDAPLFGIWSPAGKNAPFVCIEPWYGRCDAQGFEGTLSEKDWIRALEPGECFRASYTITVS